MQPKYFSCSFKLMLFKCGFEMFRQGGVLDKGLNARNLPCTALALRLRSSSRTAW